VSSRWRSDYSTFVTCVVARASEGANSGVLSSEFGGHIVKWSGVVAALELSHDYARGVRMKMPVSDRQICGGLTLSATHLFVGVDESTEESWNVVSEGDVVLFECTIPKSNGPFDGVKISIFEDDGEAYLEVTTEGGSFLGSA
ncbi:MAG: hypothetical protein AAFR07_16070, partial [Pseudomonadota bacterium]